MNDYTPPTGDELRALLARWDITQRRAATLLSVNERAVRRWVAGERKAGFSTIYTLARRAGLEEVSPGGWRYELGLATDASDSRWGVCQCCGFAPCIRARELR